MLAPVSPEELQKRMMAAQNGIAPAQLAQMPQGQRVPAVQAAAPAMTTPVAGAAPQITPPAQPQVQPDHAGLAPVPDDGLSNYPRVQPKPIADVAPVDPATVNAMQPQPGLTGAIPQDTTDPVIQQMQANAGHQRAQGARPSDANAVPGAHHGVRHALDYILGGLMGAVTMNPMAGVGTYKMSHDAPLRKAQDTWDANDETNKRDFDNFSKIHQAQHGDDQVSARLSGLEYKNSQFEQELSRKRDADSVKKTHTERRDDQRDEEIDYKSTESESRNKNRDARTDIQSKLAARKLKSGGKGSATQDFKILDHNPQYKESVAEANAALREYNKAKRLAGGDENDPQVKAAWGEYQDATDAATDIAEKTLNKKLVHRGDEMTPSGPAKKNPFRPTQK